jgi:limonene-1,2-epoxide hydrolase
MTMPGVQSSGAVVRAFIGAIESADWPALVALADPEIVFDNVPQDPPSKLTVGPAAVRDRMTILNAACAEVRFNVLTQVEQGDTVMNERVDTFRFPHGTFPAGDILEWPVATVWRVRDGRVVLWRDYYDLGCTDKQLGVTLREFGAIIGRSYTAG